MNYKEYLNNPIVQIFRQENLSLKQTQEVILKRWHTPPESFPISRIESVTVPYLESLYKEVERVAYNRKESGVPITRKYLMGQLDLTNRECSYVLRRGNY